MTQEERELLLRDLCARAQYNVKILVSKGKRVKNNGKTKYYDLVDTVYGVIFYNDEPRIVTPQNFSFLDRNGIRNFGGWTVEEVKPYLRPMSSMTEEEEREFEETLQYTQYTLESYDWLNAHHFDYRGLIEKGLALEATEGMYKIK